MRISDIKGETALDVLADLIDPAVEIMQDSEVVNDIRAGKMIHAVKHMLKGHKQAIIAILAVLNGEDPATYKVNLFTLPKSILELLNDPDVMELFHLQEQTTGETCSGPATESTEETETE